MQNIFSRISIFGSEVDLSTFEAKLPHFCTFQVSTFRFGIQNSLYQFLTLTLLQFSVFALCAHALLILADFPSIVDLSPSVDHDLNYVDLCLSAAKINYYHIFFKGYSQYNGHLANLTKKGTFSWSEEDEKCFQKMKEIMRICPVLSLLDFSKPFVLECDASGEGIGAILMQYRHSIAFESRKLQPHERLYSIYDKEMLSIMHALAKF